MTFQLFMKLLNTNSKIDAISSKSWHFNYLFKTKIDVNTHWRIFHSSDATTQFLHSLAFAVFPVIPQMNPLGVILKAFFCQLAKWTVLTLALHFFFCSSVPFSDEKFVASFSEQQLSFLDSWRSHAEFHIFFAVQGHVKIKTTCS